MRTGRWEGGGRILAASALEPVDAATARRAWPQIHEQVRLGQVGELTAQPDRWAGLSDEAAGTDGPTRYLVHRDAADALCPRNVGVWRLAVSPAGATCERTDGRPDLTMAVSALGSLYLRWQVGRRAGRTRTDPGAPARCGSRARPHLSRRSAAVHLVRVLTYPVPACSAARSRTA